MDPIELGLIVYGALTTGMFAIVVGYMWDRLDMLDYEVLAHEHPHSHDYASKYHAHPYATLTHDHPTKPHEHEYAAVEHHHPHEHGYGGVGRDRTTGKVQHGHQHEFSVMKGDGIWRCRICGASKSGV